MNQLLASWTAPVRLAVVVVVACVGCVRTDTDKETDLASNTKWTVQALGDLQPPSVPFTRNVVEFQAVRNQGVYARGPLYEIGPHDSGFDAQYPERRWVGENSLQFWIRPHRAELPTYRLHVGNRRTSVLKWLTVSTKYELLLLVDVQPTQILEYSLYRWRSGPQFSIDGEWASGEVIPSQARALNAYSSDMSLTLEPSGVVIKAGPPNPPTSQ